MGSGKQEKGREKHNARAESLEPPLPALPLVVVKKKNSEISSPYQLGDLLVIGSCVKSRSAGVSSHGLERELVFLGRKRDRERARRLHEKRGSFLRVFKGARKKAFVSVEEKRCRSSFSFLYFFLQERKSKLVARGSPTLFSSSPLLTMASAVRSKATALASAATKAAAPALDAATKNFNKFIADNAQYVVKDKEAADKLAKQLVFTKLAR